MTDLTPRVHMSGLNISNGMTWVGGKMFFIDSHARKIYVFDFNAASGSLGEPSVFLDFNVDEDFKNLEYPDGMTHDAEGKLWIVCYNSGE